MLILLEALEHHHRVLTRRGEIVGGLRPSLRGVRLGVLVVRREIREPGNLRGDARGRDALERGEPRGKREVLGAGLVLRLGIFPAATRKPRGRFRRARPVRKQLTGIHGDPPGQVLREVERLRGARVGRGRAGGLRRGGAEGKVRLTRARGDVRAKAALPASAGAARARRAARGALLRASKHAGGQG